MECHKQPEPTRGRRVLFNVGPVAQLPVLLCRRILGVAHLLSRENARITQLGDWTKYPPRTLTPPHSSSSLTHPINLGERRCTELLH